MSMIFKNFTYQQLLAYFQLFVFAFPSN